MFVRNHAGGPILVSLYLEGFERGNLKNIFTAFW